MDTWPQGPAGGGPEDLTTLIEYVEPARLGRRLRDARNAARLTQQELGGDAFSGTYVSRIEDGSRRATVRFVTAVAARLGSTPEALVTGLGEADRDRLMSELDSGEFLLSAEDSSPAVEIADSVLGELAEVDDPRLTRRALRLRAGVREAAGELHAASADLEIVVSSPVADLDWVRDLISLNRCYREGGELDRAIGLEQRFSGEITRLGLDRTTEAIQFSVSVAAALMRRGDLGRAMRLCKRAIARADEEGLVIARASALWNQSVVVEILGDLAYAFDLAQEALALFEASDDTRNLSKLRHHVADLKLLVDPPDPVGALALLERVATEIDWSKAGSLARWRQRLSEARAARMLGDRERLRAALAAATELASTDSTTTLADHHRILGHLAIDDGRYEDAQQQYRRAIALLSSIGADSEAAELWWELAGELEAADQTTAALEAYRSAGAARGMRPRTQGTSD